MAMDAFVCTSSLSVRCTCLIYGLRNIFNQAMDIKVAYTKLAHWYKDVEESGFKSFQIVTNSITLNYRSILNYFLNGSTNALSRII